MSNWLGRASILIVVGLAACVVGAPPGFSPGTTWTFPLVDPLADGKLVTPVYVNGKGPYLFAIDPDAPLTVVDGTVIAIAGIAMHEGVRLADQHDVTHPTFYATIPNVRIGSLTIDLLRVASQGNGHFDADGRQILGVLGHDVIVDSLVFGFDRERGIAWLATHDTFKPPADAHVIEYSKGTHRTAVVHKLVSATIRADSYDLHLDLGRVPNQLRQEHWNDAQLHPQPVQLTLIDDVGGHRDFTTSGIADRVEVAGVAYEHVRFLPYDDRRWWKAGELEGTLGLDFFKPYTVVADWPDDRFYVTPRERSPATTAARLARWGPLLPTTCDHLGCMNVENPVTDGTTVAMRIARDPPADRIALELVIGARSPIGEALPNLEVSLAADAPAIITAIDPRYAGATFELLDVSPFPRSCEPGACARIEPAPIR